MSNSDIPNTQTLGTFLRETRESRGLSQSAVARRAKISRNYLGELERGTRPGLSDPVAARLAKVLGVTLDEMARRVIAQRLAIVESKAQELRDRQSQLRKAS